MDQFLVDAYHLSLLEEMEDEEEMLEEEEQILPKRMWVHPAWRKRDEEGEYATLFKELVLDAQKFHEYFRMSKECFEILLDILKDTLSKKNTNYRESISAQQRLAVCLRYLATGDSMITISFSYRLGKSTVGKIIHECCEAIIQKLFSQMMPPPGPEDWKKIGKKFEDMWNFPNCLGALDGKHVVIQAPSNSGSLYFNYKHTFSIVLLALVDADYNFIAVDIGAYGRNSDGGIFMDSELGKALENGNMNIPTHQELPGTNVEAPHVIVGDAAFPLKPYLLRPYPGDNLTREKRIFNYRLSRARRVVENAFGILSQKFRIYQRRIHAKPENVDRIVLATCILHNFIKKHDKESFVVPDGGIPSTGGLQDIPLQGGNASRQAFDTRELYCQYFNSRIGMIPWQQSM